MLSNHTHFAVFQVSAIFFPVTGLLGYEKGSLKLRSSLLFSKSTNLQRSSLHGIVVRFPSIQFLLAYKAASEIWFFLGGNVKEPRLGHLTQQTGRMALGLPTSPQKRKKERPHVFWRARAVCCKWPGVIPERAQSIFVIPHPKFIEVVRHALFKIDSRVSGDGGWWNVMEFVPALLTPQQQFAS